MFFSCEEQALFKLTSVDRVQRFAPGSGQELSHASGMGRGPLFSSFSLSPFSIRHPTMMMASSSAEASNQEDGAETNDTMDSSSAATCTVGDSLPLPKHNTEYGKKTYWDTRFATETEFEWLVSYRDVGQQLEPYLSRRARILVVGCGNSSFSADLYDAGFTNIVSIDYSQVVIDAMRKRNQETRPEMQWMVRGDSCCVL